MNISRKKVIDQCAAQFGREKIMKALPKMLEKGFDEEGHATKKIQRFLDSSVETFTTRIFKDDLKQMSEDEKK